VKIKVVELDNEFSKLTTEYLAGNTQFDVVGDAAPMWMPDLVSIGALEPLDDYVAKYMNPADLTDYLSDVKDLGLWNNKRYGLFDDGDHLLWYYRKDLFADPQNQSDFKSKFGHDLGTPKTYSFQDMLDAAQFFTEKGNGQTFGVGLLTGGTDFNWFQCWFRVNGGEWFDAETMKPGINSPAALKTMQQMLDSKKYMPPGAETWDAVALFTSYLKGELAMTSFWPPLGRWAAGYGGRPKQLSFVPESQVSDKTAYALLPGKMTEQAAGFNLAVWSKSTKKDLAYWFIQWATSPEISLQRVMLPYALRDQYRLTHVDSPQFRAAWKDAPEYLDTLKDAANGKAFIDLIIPGVNEYTTAYGEAATAILGGAEVQSSLDTAATKWDDITNRIGRDKQKQNYQFFLNLPNSTLKNMAHQ
jgi:multiple sugar transport system substrate-binding protein